MILALVLVVLLHVPVDLLAQHRGQNSAVVVPTRFDSPPRWTITPRTGLPSQGYPQDPPPYFTIPPRHGAGPPLPSIGLTLPPIGLQPPIHMNRFGRHHPGRFYNPWAYPLYVVPQYVEVITPVPVPVPTPVEAPRPIGSLTLDVQPGSAQIFVDGYYVGTPDDFTVTGGAVGLEPGPHRIDLSAPGHEAVSFDVRIAANQPISYSRVLQRLEPPPSPQAPAAAPATGTPATFYLIPGCYMGNVPPKDAHLPSTCDISRAITFQQ